MRRFEESHRKPSRSYSLRGSITGAVAEFRMQTRVRQEDINDLYYKQNTLDHREVKAFLCGRYYLKDKTVVSIFQKYDANNNLLMDRSEFTAMVTDLNKTLEEFDIEESDFYAAQQEKIYRSMCFIYCCCIETLGISCYLGALMSDAALAAMDARKESEGQRLNQFLFDKLAARGKPDSKSKDKIDVEV